MGEDHIFLLDFTCDLFQSLSYCTLCFTVGGIYCLSTFAILGRLRKRESLLVSLVYSDSDVDVFFSYNVLRELV